MRRQQNNAVGPQLRSRKPSTSKTLPVLAFGILMVALASATQYFAHQFSYQAALEAHFNRIYPPWEILVWANAGGSDAGVPRVMFFDAEVDELAENDTLRYGS